jgi:hypothetical protein
MRLVGRYLAGAALGAVAGAVILGLGVVTALYYASVAFDYDAKDGIVASSIVAGALVSPLVGAVGGVLLTRWRHRTGGPARHPLDDSAG